jgi:hypothetical protein
MPTETPPNISYHTPGPQSPRSVVSREYARPASVGSVGVVVQPNAFGASSKLASPKVNYWTATTNASSNEITAAAYNEHNTNEHLPIPGQNASILDREKSLNAPSIQLPFLVHGLETEGDRIFLHHFVSRSSIILPLGDDLFRNILLLMAQKHSGLFHSILAPSSKQLDYNYPYGIKILQEHPGLDIETLEKQSQFHQEEAVKELVNLKDGHFVSHATYAQMICFVLQTLFDKKPSGQHRLRLQAYQNLIQETGFTEFIHRFFQYHICMDQLIHLPQGDVCTSIETDSNLLSTVLQPSIIRLLRENIFGGLFSYMSKITDIRNKIWQSIDLGIHPIVDDKAFHAATEINADIEEWTPSWPEGDPRDAIAMLYKQMMWI